MMTNDALTDQSFYNTRRGADSFDLSMVHITYCSIHLEIHSFIYSTREILKTSMCNMKSERDQGNALTGASIKTTNTRYNKSKNPDRSELLTKDLKVATDCTVSGVIFSEFQGAMTRS